MMTQMWGGGGGVPGDDFLLVTIIKKKNPILVGEEGRDLSVVTQ